MNKYFGAALNELHKAYDEKEKLIYRHNVFSDYHSKWKGSAHATYESLTYAVALLYASVMPERANDIIERMLSLQDLRPGSPTYGLWSWYLEEPLDEMSSPDFNWADFCSTRLLFSVKFGYDKEKVRQAILASCECIVKRDVQPTYMNICALGAFATLFAGETYGDQRIFDYGKERLKKFYDFNQYSEYNSPTYIWILIHIMSDIKREIQDTECKAMANEILDRVWGMLAKQFHPETMQLAGPMSRTYTTLLKDDILGGLMAAVFGEEHEEITKIDLNDFISRPKCPPKYRHYFEKTGELRVIKENFIGDSVANAYITPEYTIGSFECSDMWNQRRTLLAFWGKKKDVKYFNVRVLHDGYDYCAATIKSKQDKDKVESEITFESIGGDTHIDLDRIVDGKIAAKDFRVVFEFNNSNYEILNVKTAIFDGRQILPKLTRMGIEYIIYCGDEKIIDFNKIKTSKFVFTVDMNKLTSVATDTIWGE